MAHILIIDDDELFRESLVLMLEQLGHSVVEAANGLQGMACFELEAFDLVMTDLVMPEQEGIETILKIRRKKTGIKIIAMSGGGNISITRTNLESAKKLGATATLSKPFSADELSNLLAKTLA